MSYERLIALYTDLSPVHVETVFVDRYRTLDALTADDCARDIALIEDAERRNPGVLERFHNGYVGR